MVNQVNKDKSTNIYTFSDKVIQNLGIYICLVDKDITVLETNYYDITKEQKPDKPLRLGNVLRCKNGEDAGLCGTSRECKNCPIRNTIIKSYETHKGFNNIEVSMRLYTSNVHDKFIDCFVAISGTFINESEDSPMLLSLYDITFQKEIEGELEIAKKKAEEADLKKSIFVANMSHEMRTPLNAIVGFSELICSERDEKQKSLYMQIIRTNNDMLLRLVNDILDLSRIEAGTLEFVYTDEDLNMMMRELESIFRLKIEATGSPVHISFIPQIPSCHIHTERKRVQQVFSNLLGNAVKNTHKGSITFGYNIRENDIYCYVTDTGDGIPKDKQDFIFERFAKLDSNKQGAGLGLAISQMILKKLGGDIGIESKSGSGSTFWFTLPVLPLEKTNDEEDNIDIDYSNMRKSDKKILLVESDDKLYEKRKKILSQYFEVSRANTVEDTIAAFINKKFDVIILNLMFTGEYGYYCVEAIRQISIEVQIIAIGDGKEEEKNRAIANGFNKYLTDSEDCIKNILSYLKKYLEFDSNSR